MPAVGVFYRFLDVVMDYFVEMAQRVYKRRETIRGMTIVYERHFLRHFTTRFERVQ